MNLVTLLGAAAGSEEFCERLFENPLKAAGLLNIVLTETELKQLENIFNAGNREQICSQFRRVRGMLCKKPPCPFLVVIPGHKRRRKHIVKQTMAA